MTPHDRFRLGFLLKCAEDGCTADQVRGRVKMAEGALATIKNTVKGLGGLASMPFMTPTKYGLLAAAIGGPAVGYTMAKAQEQDVDPELAKKQELIAAMRLQTEQARRRAALRQQPLRVPPAATFLTRE